MGTNIRKILGDTSNRIKRTTRTGNYWYWMESSDIDIWPLVYPLRYDILVRGSFFRLYKNNRTLYQTNTYRFTELARQHSYYIWFTQVMVPRFAPKLTGNDEGIRSAYSDRLTCAAKLYDSIEKHGFDPASPIITKTGETILPTTTGITTGARYYMGDGCHRLACLLALGYEKIPCDWARVKCFRYYQPLDNTSLLRPFMNIDWESAQKYNPSFSLPDSGTA